MGPMELLVGDGCKSRRHPIYGANVQLHPERYHDGGRRCCRLLPGQSPGVIPDLC